MVLRPTEEKEQRKQEPGGKILKVSGGGPYCASASARISASSRCVTLSARRVTCSTKVMAAIAAIGQSQTEYCHSDSVASLAACAALEPANYCVV
jgi:hypothetical protein